MAEKGSSKEEGSGGGMLLVGLGIFIGAVIVFAVMKKSQSSSPPALQQAAPIINLSPIIKIDQTDLRAALMGMPGTPAPTTAETLQIAAPEAARQPLASVYSNHNDYEIERDANGRIKHIRQIRDAKITGG
jgi:hypothetical protein